MKHNPITTALLSALCTLTLATPLAAGLPTKASAQGGPPAVTTPVAPASVQTITVDAKNGLAKAVAEATTILAKPGNQGKAVTISIRTCDQQVWPREVNAKGTIVIVGCGDQPAGVNGNSKVARTDILSAWPIDGSTLRSPIELRGVTLHFNHNMFKISDSVVIRNSVIKHYLPLAVSEPRLFDVQFDAATSSTKHIVVADSYIERTRIHDGDFGGAQYSLQNNVIEYSPRVNNPTIALTPVKGDHKSVTITGNHITAIEPWLFAPIIQIERPDVTISHNRLIMERAHLDAMAFNVINPSAATGDPIGNVKIHDNAIKAPYVMLNAKGQPLNAGAITFTNNDLTGSLKMLPSTGSTSDAKHTVSPKEAVNAQRNRWGTINRSHVTATTDNPLDPKGGPGPSAPTAPVFTVDTANGLAKAITDATVALNNPLVEHATIRVTTCDTQTLPGGIHAQGKITIIGCGQTPAGVGGDDKASRTKLVFPKSRDGVIINSPVEFDGFVGEFDGKAFNPNDTLIVKNSVFNAVKPLYFSRPVFFNAAMPTTPDSKHLILSKSTITGFKLFEGKGQDQTILFADNKISDDADVASPTINLYANVHNKGRVAIIGNAFTGSPKATSSSIIISRPDVEISRNTFTFTNPGNDFSALRVFDMSPGDGPAVTNLRVEYNEFTGGHVMSNPQSTPLVKDAVQFHFNNVAGAKGMLPRDVVHDYQTLYSTSPENAVDATKNYWGTMKVANVKAITGQPLTQPNQAGPQVYVPPAPPAPGPGGNGGGGIGGGGTAPGGGPAPAPNPQQPRSQDTTQPGGKQGQRTLHRFAGETRFETAAKVSQARFAKAGDAKAVIVARADVAADSVSAAPLADEYDAPILLSQSDTLHPQAAAEIKRLLPKGGKVIFMGGEAALNKTVEDAVKGLGGQVERIAGANRAGTAVETAN